MSTEIEELAKESHDLQTKYNELNAKVEELINLTLHLSKILADHKHNREGLAVIEQPIVNEGE